MANHVATCDIPALENFMTQAGLGFSLSGFGRLKEKSKLQSVPSQPTVAALFKRNGFVKRETAEKIIDVFKAVIEPKSGETAAVYSNILEYNCLVFGLGDFVNHLASMRQYGRSDVVDLLAMESGYSINVIQEMTKRRTAPRFTCEAVLTAARARFGAFSAASRLEVRSQLPHDCKPISRDSQDASITKRFEMQKWP